MITRAMLLVPFALASCSVSPPRVTFDPAASAINLDPPHTYRVGELLLNSPPYVFPADYPTWKQWGRWGEDTKWPRDHRFTVTVERRDCHAIAAYLERLEDHYGSFAKFGSLCDLSVYGRVSRHRYSWGDATSFISQGTQDGPYAPDNGHMSYEIWGCTRDMKHLVRLRASITHPTWPEWGDESLRSFKHFEREAIDRDSAVRALRRLPPDSFTPSLTVLDGILKDIEVLR